MPREQNKSKAQGSHLMKLEVEFEKKEVRVLEIVTEVEEQLKEKTVKVRGLRLQCGWMG